MATPKKKAAPKSPKTKATTPKAAKATVKLNIQTEVLTPGGAGKLLGGTVKMEGENGLVINVAKLSKSLLQDQRARMVSSDGCISNPGGPSC